MVVQMTLISHWQIYLHYSLIPQIQLFSDITQVIFERWVRVQAHTTLPIALPAKLFGD